MHPALHRSRVIGLCAGGYGREELINAKDLLCLRRPPTPHVRPGSRRSGCARPTAQTGSVIDWMCLVASSIITWAAGDSTAPVRCTIAITSYCLGRSET